MAARIKLIVLLTIAALCINAQCYAICLANLCHAASATYAGGCHHSSHSKDNGGSDCQHRKSDLIAIEAGANFKYSPPAQLTAASALASSSTVVVTRATGSYCAVTPGRGSPPKEFRFPSLSVLRI